MKKVAIDEHYIPRNFSVTSLSRGLVVGSGVGLDALILFYFGFSKETDAYFAALAIPALISSTLDVQIQKVLIPFCMRSLRSSEKETVSEVLSNFAGICTLILAVGALLLAGFSHTVIPLLVPGFGNEVVLLAVELGGILPWIMVLGGANATLQSILLSHHRYGLVPLTKLVSNSVSILALVTLHKNLGVYALAIGALVGSACAFSLTLIATRRLGFHYKMICDLNNAQVRHMFRSLLYPLGGHALGECKTLVENCLLSFLTSGSLSALRYSSRIVETMVSVTVGSIATSTLPLVSHYAAEKKIELMKTSVLKSIKFLLFIACPMSIWLIFSGDSLVMLLFGRGKFSLEDAELTGALISLMTPYIVMSRMSTIMQSMFYAVDDTKTPAISAVINFFANVIVAIGCIKIIGIYAFPVASSVGALCTAVGMSLVLHRRFGALGWKKLEVFAGQFSAVLAMTTLAFVVSAGVRDYLSPHLFSEQVIAFVVPSAIGGVAFCAASLIFGIVSLQGCRGFFRSSRAL